VGAKLVSDGYNLCFATVGFTKFPMVIVLLVDSTDAWHKISYEKTHFFVELS
jgi:hypothetical protein